MICLKCGADEEDHFTAWENGIPVVGSYKDAPNGRICLEQSKVINDMNAENLRKERDSHKAALEELLESAKTTGEDMSHLWIIERTQKSLKAFSEKTEERRLLWSAQGKIYDPCLDSGRMALQKDGAYFFPEDMLSDAPPGATIRVTIEVIECIHDWKDVRNKVVQSGELCFRCGALRAGNAASEGGK